MSDFAPHFPLIDLKAAGLHDPFLAGTSASIGAKLKFAVEAGKLSGVGIDLAAVCSNSLAARGAKPLLFWTAFSAGDLNPTQIKDVALGVAEGCRLSGFNSFGDSADGRSFGKGELELTGFACGAVERSHTLQPAKIGVGDVVLGLASSGLHTSGFSLVRRIVAQEKISFGDLAPFDPSQTLGAALLTPTRVYSRAVWETVALGSVKALAHVTSGGLVESLGRVLPDGLGVSVDASGWVAPPIFGWLAKAGMIAPLEMVHAFNCGIGMALITSPEGLEETVALLNSAGEKVFRLGYVQRCVGAENVVFENLGKVWQC